MYLILAVKIANCYTEVCEWEDDRCHTSIHFSFSLRLLSLFCCVFPFVFSLFYFCLVCAVVIMGSQPQMSLALPCRAL